MEHEDFKENAEKEYDNKLEEDFVKTLNRRKTRLTQEELKKKIIDFLDEHVICTLATCSENVPRSTPVRYRNRGLTIYVLAEGGMKVKNIRENPRVSVSLYGHYTGFQSVRGLQLWGKAEVLTAEDGEAYSEARKIVNVEGREDLKEIGIKEIRPDMKAIKITVERARYLSFPEGILNQILEV
jgi:nitroimidazol reductase NimA-like FMN-containing flavoprotein (pyridoxamine 5'-phosphate oxidase superfamily)